MVTCRPEMLIRCATPVARKMSQSARSMAFWSPTTSAASRPAVRAVGHALEDGIAHAWRARSTGWRQVSRQPLRRRVVAGRRARSRWPAGPAPTATARSRSHADCCCRAAPSAARSSASARRRAAPAPGRCSSSSAGVRRRRRRTSPGRAAAPAARGAPPTVRRFDLRAGSARPISLRWGMAATTPVTRHVAPFQRRVQALRREARGAQAAQAEGEQRASGQQSDQRAQGPRLPRGKAARKAAAPRASGQRHQPRTRGQSHSTGCCTCSAGPSTAPSSAGVAHPPPRLVVVVRHVPCSTVHRPTPADTRTGFAHCGAETATRAPDLLVSPACPSTPR